ncbi:MAG TPA: PKD domain-containing protein [Cytophagales bacterium]|nr:PKD domain-containing protein [Cytophagales bacterium]
MIRHFLTFTILSVLLLIAIRSMSQSSPYFFIENKGQWPEKVLYRADLPSGKLFLHKNSLTYLFYDGKKLAEKHAVHSASSTSRIEVKERTNLIDMHALEVEYLNAASNPILTKEVIRTEYYNYFTGNSGTKAHAYETIVLNDLYQKVDFKFYSENNNLKYDFIVRPGGNTKDIKFRYKGAEDIYLNNGLLNIKTSVNRIIEQKPFAYQIINTDTISVPCEFDLKKDEVSFHFPDGYNKSYTLIIDPLLIFSTFSGSVADNWGFTATYGENGTLYSGGNVFDPGFPIFTGPFKGPFGSYIDVGIIKFDSTGSNILWSLILGGEATEVPHSLIINNNNELLVLGTTSSSNFPVSATAFDQTFNGGSSVEPVGGVIYNNGADIFISKINSLGTTLMSSTYIGGSNNDGILLKKEELTKNYGDQFRGDIIVDTNNNVYVSTNTNSLNIPIVDGFQSTYSGGDHDGYIFKMSPDLSQLTWSSYLGGSSSDAAFSIKLDNQSNVYVAGGTSSADFPTTALTINPVYKGGIDGFVSKIASDGKSVLSSSFLGTPNYDQAYFLDIDDEENIYLYGQTMGNYPLTAGVYRNFNGGQFIHKLNNDFSQTIFSTVFGSSNGTVSPNISPTAFLASGCHNIYIAGWASPSVNIDTGYVGGSTIGLPVTNDALQKTTNGSDFYLMVISKNADSLLYATFFGGAEPMEHVDGGTSRFDKAGVVYHVVCAGCWGNSFFTTTPNAYSRSNGSSRCNMAAFKLDLSIVDASFEVDEDIVCSAPHVINITNNSSGAVNYHWDFGDGTTSTDRNINTHEYTAEGQYTVTLTASNTESCGKKSDTQTHVINVSFPDFKIGDDGKICKGESYRLTSSGGATYEWSPAAGLNDPSIPNPIATPDSTTYYKLKMMDGNGCIFIDSILVELPEPLNVLFTINENTSCTTPFEIEIENLSSGIDDFAWDFGDGNTSNDPAIKSYIYNTPGEYSISLKGSTSNYCGDFSATHSERINIYVPNFTIGEGANICEGESYELTSSGGIAYSWSPSTGLNNSNLPNPIATPDTTTFYKVHILDENGCTYEDSVLIEVTKDIVLDFETAFTFNCTDRPEFQFVNKSENATGYLWYFGDGSTSTEESPFHIYEKDSVYQVKLEAINRLCTETTTFSLPVTRLIIPNVFTPNGDNINDYFEIKSLEPLNLTIFNRWGKEIFSKENYENNWKADGLAAGTYFYAVEDKRNNICKGWVQVIK